MATITNTRRVTDTVTITETPITIIAVAVVVAVGVAEAEVEKSTRVTTRRTRDTRIIIITIDYLIRLV
jgi:hypothetical protein